MSQYVQFTLEVIYLYILKKTLENVLLNEKFKVQNNLSSKLYLYKSRGRARHI